MTMLLHSLRPHQIVVMSTPVGGYQRLMSIDQERKESYMKKALLVAVAAFVSMCQFGCNLKTIHDVAVHVIGIGDLFNIGPFN